MQESNQSVMVPSSGQVSVRSRGYQFMPIVTHCCGCVTELKTAAAIIAVLGVVTSPAVSWAFVRHSYVIRVSCFISSNAVRADVVDIHVKNVLSFGFGANAGLGPSCLSGFSGYAERTKYESKNNTRRSNNNTDHSDPQRHNGTIVPANEGFIQTVRWIGWILLFADIIFIILSLHLLYSVFHPPARFAAKRFILSCVAAISLSFLHGMMYVGVCIAVGGSFPVFEFVFCIVDIMAWTYFVIVVNSYRRQVVDED